MMHSNGKDLSMADTLGFTHITVSADDDDDVVIQAGIADGPAEAGEDAEGAEAADEAADASDVPEEAADLEADGETDAAAESEAEPAPAPKAAAPRAERDGYRETTLDDLAEGKMSTTQKAVIVVALLGIAAFVAWYLLAR